MTRGLLALLPLSLALLTGCDPAAGIVRRTRVPFMPEPARVGMVIRTTPGIDDVQYQHSEGNRPDANQIHTFHYRGGSNVYGTLQFVIDSKKHVELSQSHLRLGSVSQDIIDATHPVMLQIEVGLEQTCGLTNLQNSIIERCYRVKCP